MSPVTEVVAESFAAETSADERPAADRVIDAALECFGRWGIAKTTLEDVAREAGLSRATVYRLFPGGKTAILNAVGEREVARLLLQISGVAAAATSLDDLLVTAIVSASESLRAHRALNYLLAHEPQVILPLMAFDRLESVLELARTMWSPLLTRFVPETVASELVEWGARMVISHTFAPGLVDPCSPTQVRRLVEELLLPGVHSLHH